MTTTSSSDIDELLDNLTYSWRRIPDVATTFSTWDELERLDFIMEWPIQEDDLERLTEPIAAGQITAEQRRRFDALLCLIEENRPMLDRLMGAKSKNY